MYDRPAHALTRPARIPGARTAADERRDIPGARKAGPAPAADARLLASAQRPTSPRPSLADEPTGPWPSQGTGRTRPAATRDPAPAAGLTRPRRRSVVAAATALLGAGVLSSCSVPASRRSTRTADPAPGLAIASTRRAQLMQILAHPDDDLYFMNPDTQRMLDAGVPLVCVYVSAGEHDGRNHIPGAPDVPADRPAYSSARHQGLRQAYATLLGLDRFTDWTKGIASLRGDRLAEINTLTNGNRRVELIFLNLPMHTTRRWMALPSLWRDRALGLQTVVAEDSPLRKAVAYDYDSLVDVLVGLMEQYRPTVVQTLDPDPDIQHSDEATRKKDSEQRGYSDHADHTAVACFSWAAMVRWVADATADGGQVPGFVATAFRGYYNRHWPKNLPAPVVQHKAAHLVPYGGDPAWECGNASGCGDYNVGGMRPLTNKKGWVRSTHHRYPGARPVVATDPDGRLAAYGVLGLRAVRWRETRPGSGQWGAPDDLGGGPLAPALGSAALPDGRQLVFGLRFASSAATAGRTAVRWSCSNSAPRAGSSSPGTVSATPSGTRTAVAASASRSRSPPRTAVCISSYATRTRASARGYGAPTGAGTAGGTWAARRSRTGCPRSSTARAASMCSRRAASVCTTGRRTSSARRWPSARTTAPTCPRRGTRSPRCRPRAAASSSTTAGRPRRR